MNFNIYAPQWYLSVGLAEENCEDKISMCQVGEAEYYLDMKEQMKERILQVGITIHKFLVKKHPNTCSGYFSVILWFSLSLCLVLRNTFRWWLLVPNRITLLI